MKRLLISLTALVAVMLLASTVMAQTDAGSADATPTPVAEEEATGEGATMADEAGEAFISLNLTAGYAMDPFLVSIEGGGTIDASDLGEGCSGYVNAAPALTLDWEGEADFAEFFYLSDHDPVMVIETPSGEFLCNDDANEQLLDPVIELPNPEQGVYNVWVGTFDEGQRFPGILVITGRPEINIGTFNLAGLVQRDAIPEVHVEAEALRPNTRADLEEAHAQLEKTVRESGTDTLTADLTAEGEFPAFDIELDELVCNGYLPEIALYAFSEDGNADDLRIFFESEQDSTLLVIGPDSQVWCNDDAEAGTNLNPLIDIPTPAAGDYYVYVGRLSLDEAVSGTLTITEESESTPVELAPAASDGGSD
jgi:hypothetical protein